jgi:mycofactocin glycosyltransferase
MKSAVAYSGRNDHPLLILDFPLKALRLNPFWIPLLRVLSRDQYTPLEDIHPLVPSISRTQVEIFLNDLVRRGFLESEGTALLSEYPFVSIIIPVRNRPLEIAACLDSLALINYPSEKIEIIVVDDASTDRTAEIVSRFPVALIRSPERRQASFCRNLAAQKAGGEILAFIDSDCLADPLWLKELVPAFKDRALGVVGGVVDAYADKKGLDLYEQVKSSLMVSTWLKRSQKADRFFYLPSCNLLCRREIFLKLGGFREDLHVGEDVDFCWRLQDIGFQLEYRPQGKVYHKHRNFLWPFCRRRFDYGTSEPWLQRRHSRRIKQLILSPAGFFFWIFIFVAIIFPYPPLLLASGGILVLDSGNRFFKIGRHHLPLSFSKISKSVFRTYLALFYHWAAFITRYYLLLALPFFFLLPLVSLTLMGLHLLTAGVEYIIKKPRLNFFSFLFYFTLDQLSYQFGVWWGCLKNRCFRPVNPVLAAGPLFRER